MWLLYNSAYGIEMMATGQLVKLVVVSVAGVIPVLALMLGLRYPATVVAGVMVLVEIVFCFCLIAEVRSLEGIKIKESVKA